MPFLIYAIDRPHMDDAREAARDAHRRHLAAAAGQVLASGALLDDDRRTVIGGLTLLDTDDRQAAERFAADDPYALADIRAETRVIAWRRRWWAGTFLGDD